MKSSNLSDEDKDALYEYLGNEELYDPSKDSGQKPADFKPQGLCRGGGCTGGHPGGCDGAGVKGYDEGGDVTGAGDFSIAQSGSDTAKTRGDISAPEIPQFDDQGNYAKPSLPEPAGAMVKTDWSALPPQDQLRDALVSQKAPVNAPPPVSAPLPPIPPSPTAPPVAPNTPPNGSKLAPDEWADLMASLRPGLGQRLGQGAAQGLGSFADAIMQGVARAGNPGFGKQIAENQQNQRQNLIQALREKYEAKNTREGLNLRSQEIGETGRHNVAEEKATDKARGLTQQAQDLEKAKFTAQQALEAKKITNEEYKTFIDESQKGSGLWNAIARKIGFGPPLPGGPQATAGVPTVVKTKGQWAALPKGTPYVDSKGKPGVKQ
jgi:hypothetical protein